MIIFEYEKTALVEGHYVVELFDSDNDVKRLTAEYLMGCWYQPGMDYDCWQSWSSFAPKEIRVIARVHLDTLTLEEIS